MSCPFAQWCGSCEAAASPPPSGPPPLPPPPPDADAAGADDGRRGSAAKVLLEDPEPKISCAQCLRQFWAFRWKHHCFACGKVFCSHCVRRSMALPQLGYPEAEEKSVCARCEKVLRQMNAVVADDVTGKPLALQGAELLDSMTELQTEYVPTEWAPSVADRRTPGATPALPGATYAALAASPALLQAALAAGNSPVLPPNRGGSSPRAAAPPRRAALLTPDDRDQRRGSPTAAARRRTPLTAGMSPAHLLPPAPGVQPAAAAEGSAAVFAPPLPSVSVSAPPPVSAGSGPPPLLAPPPAGDGAAPRPPPLLDDSASRRGSGHSGPLSSPASKPAAPAPVPVAKEGFTNMLWCSVGKSSSDSSHSGPADLYSAGLQSSPQLPQQARSIMPGVLRQPALRTPGVPVTPQSPRACARPASGPARAEGSSSPRVQKVTFYDLSTPLPQYSPASPTRAARAAIPPAPEAGA